MSKITNPELEQSVSCGFYNSMGDRRYDAMQMSRLFDGIITDGVFASIGTCLVVKAGSGTTVNVGAGKCWFNHTWTENDAILPVDCGEAEVLLDRIDAIIVEVNSNDGVRDNFIKIVKGTPASKPVRPVMSRSNGVYQYALCYIHRAAGVNEITQADITNMVGTDETPFITGLMEVVSLDELLGQWQAELDDFVASEKNRVTTEIDSFIETNETDFEEWYSQMKTLMNDAVSEVNTWTVNQKNTILAWFEGIKGQLSGDSAANLQIQLDESEVRNILMNGLPDGTKTFSDDGTVITTVDSAGRRLVKTFADEFSVCTTILYSAEGGELGTLTKEFSSDGKTITSQMNII